MYHKVIFLIGTQFCGFLSSSYSNLSEEKEVNECVVLLMKASPIELIIVGIMMLSTATGDDFGKPGAGFSGWVLGGEGLCGRIAGDGEFRRGGGLGGGEVAGKDQGSQGKQDG